MADEAKWEKMFYCLDRKILAKKMNLGKKRETIQWLIAIGIVLVSSLGLSGCNKTALSIEPKIQINIPAEAQPTSRTKLVAYDLKTEREIFFDFLKTARQVGMCNWVELQKETKSVEVMTVSFWGEAVKHRETFYILKNQSGDWILRGHGGVYRYDDPKGFPEYRYSKSSIEKLRQWYEKNIPEEDRK